MICIRHTTSKHHIVVVDTTLFYIRIRLRYVNEGKSHAFKGMCVCGGGVHLGVGGGSEMFLAIYWWWEGSEGRK